MSDELVMVTVFCFSLVTVVLGIIALMRSGEPVRIDLQAPAARMKLQVGKAAGEQNGSTQQTMTTTSETADDVTRPSP